MENPVLVTGNGTCGVNGNSKRFEADQSGESCDGSIAGPFGEPPQQVDTVTTLVGNDNAVLYQINLPDYPPPPPGFDIPDFSSLSGNLFQSQLTTLSGSEENKRRLVQHNCSPMHLFPTQRLQLFLSIPRSIVNVR